jgi:hypothetical protein
MIDNVHYPGVLKLECVQILHVDWAKEGGSDSQRPRATENEEYNGRIAKIQPLTTPNNLQFIKNCCKLFEWIMGR